jgi:hypothetical protein
MTASQVQYVNSVTYLLKTVHEVTPNSIIAYVSLISLQLALSIYYYDGPSSRAV